MSSSRQKDLRPPSPRVSVRKRDLKLKKIKTAFDDVKKKLMDEVSSLSPEGVRLETVSLDSLMSNQHIAKVLLNSNTEGLYESISEILSTALQSSNENESNTMAVEDQGSLYKELKSVNEGTSVSSDTTIQTPQMRKRTREALLYPVSCGSEEVLDDDPDDQHRLTQNKKESEDEYYNRHPNLPRARCPVDLYVSTLRPRYLDNLYETNSHAFPKNWHDLKIQDPIQAWHSLNQTIIVYTNNRWRDQGVKLKATETSVDFYNIIDLKKTIVDTIKDTISNYPSSSQDPKDSNRPQQDIQAMEKLIQRADELYRCMTSELVKIRNHDINPPPPLISYQPRLVTPSVPQPSVDIGRSTLPINRKDDLVL